MNASSQRKWPKSLIRKIPRTTYLNEVLAPSRVASFFSSRLLMSFSSASLPSLPFLPPSRLRLLSRDSLVPLSGLRLSSPSCLTGSGLLFRLSLSFSSSSFSRLTLRRSSWRSRFRLLLKTEAHVREFIFYCAQNSVSDPYSFDPDPAFQAEYQSGSNPDQGFWWPKIEKRSQKKIVLIKNCNLPIPRPPQRRSKLHNRSLQHSKENIQHFITWNSLIFSISVGLFFLPGSESGF